MKYLLPVLALTLVACNTFNGAVDGSQQIVGTTVDSAQSMVSGHCQRYWAQDQLPLLKALPLTFAKRLSKC